MIQNSFKTKRLLIEPLKISDADFIFELINTDTWIRFIGDKKIYSLSDAVNYTEMICSSPERHYWVAIDEKTLKKIGIITVIQRDYLPVADFGFAFLPEFQNSGFGFEATKPVLEFILNQPEFPELLATTMIENRASQKLLIKLGFTFVKEMIVDNYASYCYSISSEKEN